MWLIAIDDFILSDYGIFPAMLTNQSSHLGFGVDRRSGVSSSVFFGQTASPASWHVIIQCPDEQSRYALIAVLAAPRNQQVRLLAQRSAYGEDLVTTDAAITSVRPHGSSDNLEVTFESNDSIWFSEDVTSVSTTFESPLDQTLHLPVGGNIPTQPVIRIAPMTQRAVTTTAVGWRYRRRIAISNGSDEPMFRYAVRLPLGDTTALTTAKALANGDDLRVWLHGLEQSRTLVDWDTADSYVWVIVPALPPGESLTYDIVYGNALATSADGVALVAPDHPAYNLDDSTNYQHRYRTAKAVANAGLGLWPLSSGLEGGAADYNAPGAWQPALTLEQANNTDSYVQPRAQRLADETSEWYQARLSAARWRGPGFDTFDEYEGGDPFDGVVLHNPFGIRAVHADSIVRQNDAHVKTIVTTTVGDTTESTEVLTPQDPPFTRVVVIGRTHGGEGWHVLQEYGGTTQAVDPGEADTLRLYLPSSGVAPISPSYAAGWERTSDAFRLGAVDAKGATAMATAASPPLSLVSGTDVLLRQFVYALPSQLEFSTTDTVKGQVRAFETHVADDFRAQLVIRVMDASSTVKATLLDFDAGALASEFATTLTNRQFPRGGAVNLAANYTTQAGDYLVLEYGMRAHSVGGPAPAFHLRFGDAATSALPENETATTDDYPWVELTFTYGDGVIAATTTIEADWTPPRPVKHFGIAAWPARGVQIPEDAESRVFVESDGDMTVHIAAEPLIITEIEDETEIYELATEFRLRGGANAAGPYHALLVGNARQAIGPGTPRAALALGGYGVQIDTERRTHQVWEWPGAWTPGLLESALLKAWWAAPDITGLADTAEVATWVDSGVGFNATQGTSALRPTFRLDEINGLPTVRFDAAAGGDFLTTSLSASVLDESIFMVLRPSGAVADGNGGGLVGSNNTGGRAFTYTYGGEIIYRSAYVGNISGPTGVIVDIGETALLSGDLQATTWAIRKNGDLVGASGSHAVTLTVGRSTLIGTAYATFFGFTGDIAEIVITSSLGDADRQRVEGYLAHKWGLAASLPDAHPHKSLDVASKVEDISAHAVRAMAGSVREIDATDIPALQRIAATIPNSAFATNLTGWELHQDDAGWTYAASYDAAVGGEALGSMKIAATVTDAGTVLRRSATYIAVEPDDSVEVTAWLTQNEAGSSSPRIGVAWYNAVPTLIADSLDQTADVQFSPSIDHTLIYTGRPPAGATQFRVLLGVTAVINAPATKWFDDVTATILRPLRYDAELSRVTDEERTAQWLPLIPPRRQVANGDFAVNLASWQWLEVGSGVSHTGSHDSSVGGEQDGSLSIAIDANPNTGRVGYATAQYFPLSGLERVEIAAWVRASDPDMEPRLAVVWYRGEDDTEIVAEALESAWADTPVAGEGYHRAFAAIAPPEASRFRLALFAVPVAATATGEVWFDDVRLNDNELLVADVSPGELVVEAVIRDRWIP